jgi:hypothetical protein
LENINVKKAVDQVQWLTPIILVTEEADIGRMTVQNAPGQKVSKNRPPTPISTNSQACWHTPVIPNYAEKHKEEDHSPGLQDIQE